MTNITRRVTALLATILTAAITAGIFSPSLTKTAQADGPTPAVCYFNSTPPSLTNGQPTTCQTNSGGDMKVQVAQAGIGAQVFSLSPNYANGGAATGLFTDSSNLLSNLSGWDAATNNITATIISAASYTTTQTSADQTNFNGRGLQCVLDDTVPGTGSVTFEIDGKDTTSGKYYALLTGLAVTTTTTNVYTVYPAATATANVTASLPVPRFWRGKATANNANAVTYSVGCTTIL